MADDEKQPTEYSLAVREEPIILRGPDGQVARSLIMREMLGPGRAKYLNKVQARIKIAGGQAAGMTTFEGMNADLLEMCLFDAETQQPVKRAEIETWPAGMQEQMFKQAQRLNALNKQAVEDAKND
jgi:hypothetical protein